MKLISSTLLLTFVMIVAVPTARPVHYINNNQREVVHSYVSQSKSIAIPFKKCFKAHPQSPVNDQLVSFLPTRLGLSPLAHYPLASEATQLPLLTQLRSPSMHRHTRILKFKDHLIALDTPNTILVVKEDSTGFRLTQQYHLQGIRAVDQLKLFSLEQRAIGFVYGSKQAYLLDQQGYIDLTLPHATKIVHIVALNENQFVAACFRMGMIHYRLDRERKAVEVVRQYTGESLGLGENSFRYVVDVSLQQYKRGVILALDAWLGVVEVPVGKGGGEARVLVSQKMCESFDTIEEEHMVLLCQNQGHSTIIEAYRRAKPDSKGHTYRTVQPVFHYQYLNDLHVTWNYYLVYSYNSLHVFWNTQRNRLPQSLATQSQIPIDGLETFTIESTPEETILYTIEDGQLSKYALHELRPQLTLSSPEPIHAVFKLQMFGSCEDLPSSQVHSDKVATCKVVKEVELEVEEEDRPRESDVGISVTIVAILVTVLLIVLWICLSKYKSLEREARKILEGYQKRKSRRPV